MPGTLFVVATPIGNLEDLTFRALRTLKEAEIIAAEDTRRTSKLLAHYGVQKPLMSLHEHNELREAPRLVARMLAGASIALVTDAGTPGISDPGQLLVRLAREAGLTVSPIPGPSAITAALSVSGFQGTGFVFMGFPPPSGSAREDWLVELTHEPRIIVFFEAPHRVRRTMSELAIRLAERPIHLYREISKVHEELVVKPNNACADATDIREQGEFVIVVSNCDEQAREDLGDRTLDEASLLIGLMTEHGSLSELQAIVALSAAFGVKPGKLERALKKAAIRAKRQAEASS